MFGLNARRKQQPLDQVLLKWNDYGDVFRKRDLLQSVCVQGASGSGKTSGVGYQLGKALVRDKGISGLILASKPGEDRQFWTRLFADCGRKNALIVVVAGQASDVQLAGLGSPERCRFPRDREFAHDSGRNAETRRRRRQGARSILHHCQRADDPDGGRACAAGDRACRCV